jgi:hypothetical protein
MGTHILNGHDGRGLLCWFSYRDFRDVSAMRSSVWSEDMRVLIDLGFRVGRCNYGSAAGVFGDQVCLYYMGNVGG